LDLTRATKIYVKAYREVNGRKTVLATSMVAHVAGIDDPKYTNAKAIRLKKARVTVKVGSKSKIKATVVLKDKNKKSLPKSHAARLRFKSTDKSIATVSKKGVIRGIKKGKCKIYVTAINGLSRKVTATVK
jgi:uncharacterized protein YjdB